MNISGRLRIQFCESVPFEPDSVLSTVAQVFFSTLSKMRASYKQGCLFCCSQCEKRHETNKRKRKRVKKTNHFKIRTGQQVTAGLDQVIYKTSFTADLSTQHPCNCNQKTRVQPSPLLFIHSFPRSFEFEVEFGHNFTCYLFIGEHARVA